MPQTFKKIAVYFSKKWAFDKLPESLKDHPDNLFTLRNKFISRATRNSTLTLVLSIFSILLAFGAVIMTVRTQQQAVRITTETQTKLTDLTFQHQRALKEIDLRRSFQERYNDLTADISRVKSEEDAKAYYLSYWRLQLEEYQYWCQGFIGPKLYATWAESRRSDWEKNKSFNYKGGSYDYRQGWEYMRGYFAERDRDKGYNQKFIDFFDLIFFRFDVIPDPKTHCEQPSPSS